MPPPSVTNVYKCPDDHVHSKEPVSSGSPTVSQENGVTTHRYSFACSEHAREEYDRISAEITDKYASQLTLLHKINRANEKMRDEPPKESKERADFMAKIEKMEKKYDKQEKQEVLEREELEDDLWAHWRLRV